MSDSQPEMPTLPPLLVETVILLQNRPARIKLRHIAEATGLKLRWLSELQTKPEDCINSSVGRLTTLNQWLKAQIAQANA
jgi:hypothetical protein